MGEAGLEGLIGAEYEAADAEAGTPSADPVAVAVAMDAAKHDPELSRKAGNYLDEQLSLVRLQVKHFDEERHLAIAAAKRKRYADRIRNAAAHRHRCGAGTRNPFRSGHDENDPVTQPSHLNGTASRG